MLMIMRISSIEFYKESVVNAIKGIINAEYTISLDEFSKSIQKYKSIQNKLNDSIGCGNECNEKLIEIDGKLCKINSTYIKIEAAIINSVAFKV